MPRSNWKTAPQRTLENLQGWHASIPTLENADGWVRRVVAAGYDLEKSEVPQKCTQELRATPEGQRGFYRIEHGAEIASEARAMRLWESQRTWSASSSLEADLAAAKAKAEADVKAKEKAVQARTKQILADQAAQLQTDARRRAEREING